MSSGLLVPLLLSAVAQAPAIPDRFDAELAAHLPRGQVLVQKLVADVDGDKKPEWIAVGEPADALGAGMVSVAIFAPPKGGGKPTIRFAQRLAFKHASRAGAIVRQTRPVGPVLILVAAAPDEQGDSRFTVQVYAWNGKDFRPVVPEALEFGSQGGFAFEDVDPAHPGEELRAWTYLRGEGEQLWDFHHYAWKTWHWDGVRWTEERGEHRTAEKQPDPAAGGRAAGLKNPDLRRTVPRVAEVP